MSRGALLCIFLSLGSASAFGNWLKPKKNVKTECGYFRTLREGWLWDSPMTDFDTAKELEVLKWFDANKDGYITRTERYEGFIAGPNQTPTLDLQAGEPRCAVVEFLARTRNMDTVVASYLFDMLDANRDNQITVNDVDLDSTLYNQVFDTNGDQRVSVCELFQGVMRSLQIAENRAYLIDLKFQNIVNKSRKFNIYKWMAQKISSWGW